MDNLIEDQKLIQHEIYKEMKNSLHRLRHERNRRKSPSGCAGRIKTGTQENLVRNERPWRHAGQAV